MMRVLYRLATVEGETISPYDLKFLILHLH